MICDLHFHFILLWFCDLQFIFLVIYDRIILCDLWYDFILNCDLWKGGSFLKRLWKRGIFQFWEGAWVATGWCSYSTDGLVLSDNQKLQLTIDDLDSTLQARTAELSKLESQLAQSATELTQHRQSQQETNSIKSHYQTLQARMTGQ